MAQRCVPITLKRAIFDANWERETVNLIENRRWEIISDIINILERSYATLDRYSRWSAWEMLVLSRVGEPRECQRVIEERQAAIDEDQSEADLVREGFRKELRIRGYCPDTQKIWIPSREAAFIVNRIENEERRAFAKAMAHLYTLRIPEIRKCNRDRRGCLWTGAQAGPQVVEVSLNES